MINRIIFTLIIGLTFCLSQASAETIKINYKNGYGANVGDVYFNGSTIPNVGAGEFLTTGDFYSTAYCLEFDIDAITGIDVTATITDPSSYSPNLDSSNTATGYYSTESIFYAVWLMDEFSVGLGNFDPASTSLTAVDSFTNAEAAAALQLAIWDAVYDFNGSNYDGHGNGLFGYSETGDINTLYSYFLGSLLTANTASSITNSISGYKVAQIYDTTNQKDGQDILVYNPVPEPGTMVLFGFGLLGFGMLGRKQQG